MSWSTSTQKTAKTTKPSRAEQLRKFRTEQPGHARANARRYREGHKEQIATYKKGWRATKREHLRAVRESLPGRAWREAQQADATDMEADAQTRRSTSRRRWVCDCAGIRAEPLGRILESIEQHLGDTFVLIFPRQSGKDEVLIDLMLYLADLYSVVPGDNGGGASDAGPAGRGGGAEVRRGGASQPADAGQVEGRQGAHATAGEGEGAVPFRRKRRERIGATATLLLVINEAQDIAPEVYAHNFEPMAASTNATRLIVGTAWTSRTLLAQERRLAEQAERRDGRRRVFTVTAEEVSELVPWYGAHLRAVIEKHGRQHPMVRTQYFNEELDAQGGMFDARRRALIFAQRGPGTPSRSAQGDLGVHVFCIDVAGQDERGTEADLIRDGLGNPGRDATTLSIVRVDLGALETLQAPVFRVVRREQWVGASHVSCVRTAGGTGRALAAAAYRGGCHGRGRGIVVDAGTGIPGAEVMPVKFTAQKKSEMGYRFLSLIEAGRFRDECWNKDGTAVTREMVDEQYEACASEILTGPQKTMRWGVPDGRRNARGELIHDDVVMADALITEVDQLEWRRQQPDVDRTGA